MTGKRITILNMDGTVRHASGGPVQAESRTVRVTVDPAPIRHILDFIKDAHASKVIDDATLVALGDHLKANARRLLNVTKEDR